MLQLADFSMGQNQQVQTQEEGLELECIQALYRSFITQCPSGSLYLHEFKKMFGVQHGTPESHYMDSIFRAFDMNHVSYEDAFSDNVSTKQKQQSLFYPETLFCAFNIFFSLDLSMLPI